MARAERIEQLRHDDFRIVAGGSAGTGIEAGQGADFVPETELLDQGFQGGQAAEGGLFAGREEREAEAGRALGDRRHGGSPSQSAAQFPARPKNVPRRCNLSGHGEGSGGVAFATISLPFDKDRSNFFQVSSLLLPQLSSGGVKLRGWSWDQARRRGEAGKQSRNQLCDTNQHSCLPCWP